MKRHTAFLALIFLGSFPTLANEKGWTTFLGPDRDGKSKEMGTLLPWGENGPPELWRSAIGEGYTGPVVDNERVFQFDRYGDEARLVCFAADSGKILWQVGYSTAYEDLYGFSNGPRASPLIDGDRVYTFGSEGRLRCYKVNDGKVLWDIDIGKKYGVVQNFFGVGSSPVIYKGLLLVMVGGSPMGSPSIQSGKVVPDGSGIVAFDKLSGQEVYRAGDYLASYASLQTATYQGRDWGFAFMRGGLLGFDPQAGETRFFYPWRARRLESVNAATPVIVGDKVFITESYEKGGVVLRYAGDAPEVVWQDPPRRNQSLASHWSTSVHHEGYLYGCHGESAGSAELRCVSLNTGEVVWRKTGLRRTSLIYANDHLFVLGENGTLTLVAADPSGYKEIAKHKVTKNPAWNTPALQKGRLFVRGGKELVALRVMGQTD